MSWLRSSSRHYAGEAKHNIDVLVDQLEDRDSRIDKLKETIAGLRDDNDALHSKNDTKEKDITFLREENKFLKDEKTRLLNQVGSLKSELKSEKSHHRKALDKHKQRRTAQDKALKIAKNMTSFGPRTNFRTWMDTQASFREAVEDSDKTCRSEDDNDEEDEKKS